jgi:hypothetical protein
MVTKGIMGTVLQMAIMEIMGGRVIAMQMFSTELTI